MADTLRPYGLRVAAPRVARQGGGSPSRSSRTHSPPSPVGFGAAIFTRFASEGWCGRPGSNRHSPFEPRDFLTSYGFRRLAVARKR